MDTTIYTNKDTDAIYRVSYLALSFMLIFGFALMGCEGPQGPQGERGPVGPANEDGGVMYADEGAPDENVGALGDYYLDSNTGELYGPKDENGWGTPISLQGPPGENGSQIYAGSGGPDDGLGTEGDYYLDQDNYELYGPKTGSDWETPISLKGTANVLYSSWLDIDWNETDEDTFKRMAIPESRITDEFLDTGVVKMYLKTEGGDEEGSFRQIFTLPLAVENTTLYFSAITSTGVPPANVPSGFTGLLVTNEPLNGNDVHVLPLEDFQIRYVLIPGGEQLKAKDGPVDLDNYQQVKHYFGIPNK